MDKEETKERRWEWIRNWIYPLVLVAAGASVAFALAALALTYL